jgi:hypothetical protein
LQHFAQQERIFAHPLHWLDEQREQVKPAATAVVTHVRQEITELSSLLRRDAFHELQRFCIFDTSTATVATTTSHHATTATTTTTTEVLAAGTDIQIAGRPTITCAPKPPTPLCLPS